MINAMKPAKNDPIPPPPEGVLWSLVGDIRMLLTLPAALTMQVAHPAVGAGRCARAGRYTLRFLSSIRFMNAPTLGAGLSPV